MEVDSADPQPAGFVPFEISDVDTTPQADAWTQISDTEMTEQMEASSEINHDSYNAGDSSPLPAAPQVLPEVRPWNRANRGFEIFIDNDAASVSPAAATPRHDGRRILGLLKPNALHRTGPRLRSPSTPFTFNIFDANWEDLENYEDASPMATFDYDPSFDSSPAPATPFTPATPVTPAFPTFAPEAAEHTRPSKYARALPKPQSVRSPLRRRQRHLVPAGSPSQVPRNMELYKLLDIKDWTASISEIKAAYKMAAVKYHPDKFDEENREMAHVRMSRINAARDVLVDESARKQYHEHGRVPWMT